MEGDIVEDAFECPAFVLNFEGPDCVELLKFLALKHLYETRRIVHVKEIEANLHFKFAFTFLCYRCVVGGKKIRYKFNLRSDTEKVLPIQTDPSLVEEPIVSLITIKKDFLTEEDYCDE